MVFLAFVLLLLASVGGEGRSLKNTIHGQQVAQDHAAQSHRLQGLALLASSSSNTSSSLSTATTSGTARPTTAAAATGIGNIDSTAVGFSIYSASNLPTGVLEPPSSCADALMTTIECNSTILFMGYDLPCATIIVHDDQRFTESTRLSTLLVLRQCVPPHARHPSNPTGLTS
jgi:hypothetical protein